MAGVNGDDRTAPPPSILMSLFGVCRDPRGLPESDDAVFDAFYDVGIRKGWALDQVSPPQQAATRPLWESYEAGFLSDSATDPFVVFWCYVGVNPRSRTPPLRQLALSLEEVSSEFGSIDLAGIQVTVDLDAFIWVDEIAQRCARDASKLDGQAGSAAVYGTVTSGEANIAVHDGPSPIERFDFSQLRPELVRSQLTSLPDRSDKLGTHSTHRDDGACLTAYMRTLAVKAIESGRHGQHRIVVVVQNRLGDVSGRRLPFV